MKKINFKDLPNEDTPINSVNLNQLQSNVEETINNDTLFKEEISNVTIDQINAKIKNYKKINMFSLLVVSPIGDGHPFGTSSYMIIGQTSSSGNYGINFALSDNSNSPKTRKMMGGVFKEWITVAMESKAEYLLTNFPAHSAGDNIYELSKSGKVVTLAVDTIWLNSISANTWTNIGQLPKELKPSKNMSSIGILSSGSTGNTISYGKVNLLTSGVLRAKMANGSSSLAGISLNLTWIID